MDDETRPERTPKPQAAVPPPRPPKVTKTAAGADDADQPRKRRVQRKKETLRLNLPPKPSPSPPIRLAAVAASEGIPSRIDTLWIPIAQQLGLLMVAAMVLDGGESFQVVAYAALGFWGGFFLMFARRRNQLTRADRILLRWGFLILCVISSLITNSVWFFRGFSH